MKKKRIKRLLMARGLLTAFFAVMSAFVIAQAKPVTGTVVDENNQPVIGASVVVQGTSVGVTTDVNGNFTINARPENVLEVTFVGYEGQAIPVGSQVNIRVVLAEDSQQIDEVVVIGYGTARRSDVTGAITSVSEKTLRERPVQNALSAMQGKAAGVDIQTNVRPGTVSSIDIRGKRSIKGTNDPLYVVDGVILMGDMNDINPSDIASIEILKDASSTAIYGSRGANGVILVTTKRGSQGRISIDYNATFSFDYINSLTDWASSGEVLDRVRTARINANQYTYQNQPLTAPNLDADIEIFGHNDAATIAALQKAYEGGNYNGSRIPTTDWIDKVTRTGVTQNHQISLSQATEKSRIYTSLGYYKAKGVQLNQDYERYTARINAELTPIKWLTIGTTSNVAFSEQKWGHTQLSGSATGARDLYGSALGQYRMAQPYDEEGNLIVYPGNNQSSPVWNPLINIDHTDDLTRILNLQVNAFGEVRFTPWLSYRINVGTGYRTTREGRWQGSQSTTNRKPGPNADQSGTTSSASYKNDEAFQWLIENILSFNKTFGVHNIGATLVQSGQRYHKEGSEISANKILYDASKWHNLKANYNGNPSGYDTSFTENSLASYMGRINYSLMDKYLLSAAIRYDGASVLAPGNKWDYFPSVAVAWKMQEEAFLQPVQWLDELKLRVGYGVTGNSAVDPYTTMGPLSQYNYVWGTNAAISMIPKDMPNPKLGWEKTEQWNIGLDFGFLNRRLTGTLEVYQSKTSDLLMDRDIPGVTGFVKILDNIGKTENKGIELSLSSVNIQKRDFRWTTDFNLAHNKEKVTSLVNGKEDMPGSTLLGTSGYYIGQPQRFLRYYKVDGLWQNTPEDLAEIQKWKDNGYNFSPGQYKPVEQGEADHKLDEKDLVIYSRNPKVVLGLTNTFTYKDFELSFFIYARLGQKYFANLTPAGADGGDYIGYARKASLNDFWREDNTGAKYPMLTAARNTVSDASVNRSANVHNGSFVAVRHISLGYNLPERFLRPVKLSRCQVFAQVLNPFLWGGDVVKAGFNPDDTNGWADFNSVGDPQGGTNNNTYITTSMVFGVRIGF